MKTTGWAATCTCEAPTHAGRAVVLDMFGGSGTTAEVARECGCDWLLIELKPEYIELARKRLEQPLLI